MLLERAFRPVVSFALVGVALVFLLYFLGRPTRTLIAVVFRCWFLPSWDLCERPALTTAFRLSKTPLDSSQSIVKCLQVLMKTALLALQAEGNEVDAFVLIIKSGMGGGGGR